MLYIHTRTAMIRIAGERSHSVQRCCYSWPALEDHHDVLGNGASVASEFEPDDR